MKTSISRSRWAAIGAAVAVALGAGTIGITHATEPAGATTYVPITPCRLLDTRPAPDNVGIRNTPLAAGEIQTVSAHGDNGKCVGIPATASGLSLNVTALNSTAASFLTIWPTGAAQPFTANLNPTPGEPPTPNAVTTGLSAGGQFDIYNFSGSVDVVVDVFGYYTNHQHTGADIVDESLTGADVQNETITGADVDDGSIANTDTSNEPGVTSAFMTDVVSATTSPTSIASASIRVPSNGYVAIEVTGDWLNNNVAGTDRALCQLQKGAVAAIDTTQPFFTLTDRNDASNQYDAFSAHRVLPILAADNPFIIGTGQALRLVCDEQTGDVQFDSVHITGTFYATDYDPSLIFIPLP